MEASKKINKETHGALSVGKTKFLTLKARKERPESTEKIHKFCARVVRTKFGISGRGVIIFC